VAIAGITLWKYGRYERAQCAQLSIRQLPDAKTLTEQSSAIVGATGYGIYQLLAGKNFPQLFDWVVFDESSQILPAYALLALIFGKGQALFYGDTQQLPPVVMGNYEGLPLAPRSILQELALRYKPPHRLRLNETYRMNRDICQFVSRNWYDGELRSVVPPEKGLLQLPNFPHYADELDAYLDPAKAMATVLLEHEGCTQASADEALWIARAVRRLIESYGLAPSEIGIISPHRLQNNRIAAAIKETQPYAITTPKIDTVERMQGQEFDVVLFSATVSDPETIHSRFIKDYRRFNVALTRARKKFLLVASARFFDTFPSNERELTAQFPFDDFLNLWRV
jgi:superfamily I DNA and/or RNA helicase